MVSNYLCHRVLSDILQLSEHQHLRFNCRLAARERERTDYSGYIFEYEAVVEIRKKTQTAKQTNYTPSILVSILDETITLCAISEF